MSATRDYQESSECCFACRFAAGAEYASCAQAGENALFCTLHRRAAEGWGCGRFEREPGADHPSEWKAEPTVVFMDGWREKPSRRERHESDAPRRQIAR